MHRKTGSLPTKCGRNPDGYSKTKGYGIDAEGIVWYSRNETLHRTSANQKLFSIFARNQSIEMPSQKTAYRIALFLIISMHIAGFIGLQYFPLFFRNLVPFNLVATTMILLYFHRQWNEHFIYLSTIVCFIGYWVEVLGVKTGLIFGIYTYGDTLGFKVLDVPVLIAFNWFVLLYVSGVMIKSLNIGNMLVNIVAGAALMILMDFLIEPVAIRQDFWSWANNEIPIRNYIAWFAVAFILHFLWNILEFKKENKVAFWIYSAQFLFFLAHNITYWQNN